MLYNSLKIIECGAVAGTDIGANSELEIEVLFAKPLERPPFVVACPYNDWVGNGCGLTVNVGQVSNTGFKIYLGNNAPTAWHFGAHWIAIA